ncbi:MAG: META domain-containing protein [Acidimicrobiia bacterium]
MNLTRTSLLALVTALVAVSCGGRAADQELDQSLWRLASIADTEIDSEPPATIAFGEGEVVGTTGCNAFGGSYEADADSGTISFGLLRSTLVACSSEGLTTREQAMFAALEVAATYEVKSGTLEFMGSEGEVVSTYSVLEPDLADTSWLVTGYNNGSEAVTSVIIATELTVEFGDDETVSGSAGCNTFSGTYEVSGDYEVVSGQAIAIGPLASTQMACLDPEGLMDQEAQFLNALANSATWQLVGSNLELRSADGALQVTAEPAS